MGFLSPGIWSKNPGAKATNNAVGITMAAAFIVDSFGKGQGSSQQERNKLAGNENVVSEAHLNPRGTYHHSISLQLTARCSFQRANVRSVPEGHHNVRWACTTWSACDAAWLGA